jgi:hypothetical protein
MRYTLINGLLLLAVSPFTALALPVDPNPNDQGGVWDPSGQYRKGHYDGQGNFIANNGGQTGYENGYQNEQWRNGQNQNGQYNQNNQYNQNGQYNRDGRNNEAGRWQRRWIPGQDISDAAGLRNHGTHFGTPGVGIPGTGIHARTWPNDNNNNDGGWTDANGQWHANNQQGGWTDANGVWHATNQQGGWTDANGQWHATNNNNNNQDGWTDANGQWHSNNQQGGWTDANGVWHNNQKRGFEPTATTNLAANPNLLNQAQASNPLNAAAGHGNLAGVGAGANNAAGLPHVPRHYNPDSYDNDRDNDRYEDGYEDGRYNNAEDRRVAENVASNILSRRIWPFTSWNNNNDNNNNWDRDCDRNDWNCRNRNDNNNNDDGSYNYNTGSGYDKCESNDRSDRSGWSCRSDWDRNSATPTPRVWSRNSPIDNTNYDNKKVNLNAKENTVTPTTAPPVNTDYKNVENKGHENNDHHQDKDLTTSINKE